jgi:hypothetical protein
VIDKSLWLPPFEVSGEPPNMGQFPRWSCPTCRSGHLRFAGQSLRHESDVARPDDEHSDYYNFRFSMRLHCDSNACGEAVTVDGTSDVLVEQHPYEKPDGTLDAEQEVTLNLTPRVVWPAPRMLDWDSISPGEWMPFPVPKTVTVARADEGGWQSHVADDTALNHVDRASIGSAIQPAIDRASALYWLDPDAAVAALGTGVERLFDALGVPTMRGLKKGKQTWAPFSWRVAWIGAAFPDAEAAIGALVELRHEGTHESGYTHSQAFDAFRILEKALVIMFGKPDELPDLIKEIRTTKGHPRKKQGN